MEPWAMKWEIEEKSSKAVGTESKVLEKMVWTGINSKQKVPMSDFFVSVFLVSR